MLPGLHRLSLAEWEATFGELDKCPWPGPRPMKAYDGVDALVARAKAADRFTTAVLEHQVVVLTGESGVGKSSMLTLGLMPQLNEDGFTPMLCDTWGGLADDIEPDQFVASKVALPDGIHQSAEAATLLDQLDHEYDDSAVLVLDQFEELIRYQPEQFQRMSDWVVNITRRHRTRVVISLRSEYEHRLATMARQIRPLKMTRFVLEPLTATSDIREIMQPTHKDRDKPKPKPKPITPAAVDAIAQLWKDRDVAQVGLLHLQALLYVLHADAAGELIDVHHVHHVTAAAPSTAQHQTGTFEHGLIRAVRLKLDRCVAAARSTTAEHSGLDDTLVYGTEALIRRMITQLSSGGYKLVREQWDLARAVLDREITQLQVPNPREVLRQLTRDVPIADLLSPWRHASDKATSVETNDSQDDSSQRLARLGVIPAPWHEDPDDASSGAMAGMSPRDVLREEMRRFIFAVHWLVTSSLVRTTSWSNDRTLISLIHDGFAAGLRSWSTDDYIRPAEAVHRLTASRGETFDWTNASDTHTFNGETGHCYLVNVRWVSCRIFAIMRRVVFVNCDFRGSTFINCHLEGVTFINCLLDGATFDQCTIHGQVGEPTRRDKDAPGLPAFLVHVPAPIIDTLSHYRGGPTNSTQLLSRTSGVAAIPWIQPVPDAVDWTPQEGGLAMLGGRLTSLAVRRTHLDRGEIAFWYVAGTSLELAEQTTTSLKIFQAAIRGLSLTPPVGTKKASQATIYAEDTKLYNTWLGHGLTGTVHIKYSVIIQFLNASTGLAVHFDNCQYHGATNIQPATGASFLIPDVNQDTIAGITTALEQARNQMDYRSTPARLELQDTSSNGPTDVTPAVEGEPDKSLPITRSPRRAGSG